MPVKSYGYYARFKMPKYRTEQRIKIPAIIKRPVRFQVRSLIRQEFIHKNPWWFTLHRRGIKGRPHVGVDQLEARAVPHSLVRGTLPERIVYAALVVLLRFVPDVDFEFQCVAGHHKVLTADMKWVSVASLKIGDKLLSFTEYGNPNRAWTIGTVIHNEPDEADTVNVELSNGDIITCTSDHPWLVHYSRKKYDWSKGTSYSWVKADDLKIGAYIPKFLRTWEPDLSYASGWLSGFFDGEGSVVHGKTRTGGHALSLTLGQNAGEMFDGWLKYLRDVGFEFTVYDYRDKYYRSYDNGYRQSLQCRIKGGRSEALRFLGTVRPMKIKRLDIERSGKLTKLDAPRVVSIVPSGKQTIYRLGVDTKTYLADGYGMHNSSLQGGRVQFGGIVADFMFPFLKLVIQVQGPTHAEFIRIRKDTEQELILADMGYQVVYIDEDTIYDEIKLDAWLRGVFGWTHSGGSGESIGAAPSLERASTPISYGKDE